MKALFMILVLMIPMSSYCQINISLLHQLVEDSKSEHEKQMLARETQARNAIHEEGNRNLLTEVKNKNKTLQERFSKLTVLAEVAGIGSTAHPLVRSILENQQKILFYCKSDPGLVPFALETEKIFARQSHSLLNYMLGLSASMGDLNQMKTSERRLLFQHVLHELRGLNQLSQMTTRSLESLTNKNAGGKPFPDYPVNDQHNLDDILSNIQIPKP